MRPRALLLAAALGCALASGAEAQDAAAGAAGFRTFCAACHSTAKDGRHMQGPALHGVAGRKAGTAPGYRYSAALRAFGKTWTPETLDAYLADPKRVVPKGAMNVRGVSDPVRRRDIVIFLTGQR